MIQLNKLFFDDIQLCIALDDVREGYICIVRWHQSVDHIIIGRGFLLLLLLFKWRCRREYVKMFALDTLIRLLTKKITHKHTHNQLLIHIEAIHTDRWAINVPKGTYTIFTISQYPANSALFYYDFFFCTASVFRLLCSFNLWK